MINFGSLGVAAVAFPADSQRNKFFLCLVPVCRNMVSPGVFMFGQRIDQENILNTCTDARENSYPLQNAYPEPSPLPHSTAPEASKQLGLRILLRALPQKKARDLPIWLRESIGWGGFIGILAFYLVIQIYLNGVFNGVANQVVIGLSGVLEIGTLWLWELYWY